MSPKELGEVINKQMSRIEEGDFSLKINLVSELYFKILQFYFKILQSKIDFWAGSFSLDGNKGK